MSFNEAMFVLQSVGWLVVWLVFLIARLPRKLCMNCYKIWKVKVVGQDTIDPVAWDVSKNSVKNCMSGEI